MMNKLEKLQNYLNSHLYSTSWDYDGYVKAFPSHLYNPQNDWNQTLMTKINQISAMIFQDTNRSGANVIIIPDNMVDIFRTLEYMKLDPISYDNYYYKMGVLAGRYNVFVVPRLTSRGGNPPDLTEYYKVFVCKLDSVDTDNIHKCVFDIEKYLKVGIIKINRPVDLQ